MADRKILLGNVRGEQGPAGPNTVSSSTTTSGFENGHVLYNNNGKVGAKKLGASDVGAQPAMGIEPLSITASDSGFSVNGGSFAVKYGALRIVFASITVKSVGSEGWVKVADVSGAAAVKTVHRVLASSGGTADSIAVYVNPNSIEMYLSNKDVGKTIYVDAVSYYS